MKIVLCVKDLPSNEITVGIDGQTTTNINLFMHHEGDQ